MEQLDELVESALEADCEMCRSACNVGAPAKKSTGKDPYAVKPTIVYEPKPYPGAETTLAEKQHRDRALPEEAVTKKFDKEG